MSIFIGARQAAQTPAAPFAFIVLCADFKMRQPLPSSVELRILLRYEPETGKLFWRPRPKGMFESQRIWRSWNTKWAGREAFTSHDTRGHLQGYIQGVRFSAHRIIWRLETGEEPDEIDHINGVRDDNRWHNLRDCSRIENMRNARRSSANESGVTGVRWNEALGKWHVRIGVRGKKSHIGYFADFEEAVSARKAAERDHDFHPNHGREAA